MSPIVLSSYTNGAKKMKLHIVGLTSAKAIIKAYTSGSVNPIVIKTVSADCEEVIDVSAYEVVQGMLEQKPSHTGMRFDFFN